MPKKKGDKGGNPQPVQTEAFLAQKFKPGYDIQGVKMAKANLCVKLPEEWDAIVRPMPFRSEWLRKAIKNQLIKDGWLDD